MIAVSRVISVISGKGGVGKTTLVSNLAVALSRMGRKVTVIDANITGANLSVHLGLVQYDKSINDVLGNDSDISDVIYTHPSGFNVVPASLNRLDGDMSRLKGIISHFVGVDDYIIIDAAAGVEGEVRSAVECSDSVILVTTPEITAISNVALASELCAEMSKNILGVVVNQVHGDSFEVKPEQIGTFLGTPVIAKIDDHKHVRESVAVGVPVVGYSPKCQPSKAIFGLAEKITEF